MNPYVLLLLTILSIGTLYIAPNVIVQAHADRIGEICIAPHGSTSCPPTLPTIPGPLPAAGKSFFLVDIAVNGSQPLSSFDITIVANSSDLLPSGAFLGSSILTNVHELLKCIGVVNKLGSTACPPTDTVDTIEYRVTGDLIGNAFTPVDGVLFTANYTVLTPVENIPIKFQTGCTTTSVPGGVCVTIQAGTFASVPETVQTAKFSNEPYFDLLPSSGIIQVARGDSTTSPFLDIPSLNGFGGTNGLNVDLTTSVSAIGSLSPLPLFSVSPTSVTVAVGSDGLSGMNITVPASTPPGMYVLNITGTSSGVPPNSVTLQLIVPIPDFNIAPSPPHVYVNVTATSPSPFVPSGFLNHTAILAVNVVDYVLSIRITGVLTVLQGSSEIQPVTLAATDIYNVTVSITSVYVAEITPVKIITSNGINVACSPNPVMIISRNNASLHVVGVAATDCNVQGITVGNYIVTVVSTSGAQNRTSIHSISFQVSVIAPSFSIILPSTVPTIPVGSSATIPATYAGNNGLKDNISASVFISSNGLSPLPTISGNGTIVSVTQTSPNATISFTISASSTTPPGTYILRIHGDGVKSIPGHFDVTI